MKVVILAGGGGTRLWPYSREGYPKQFLVFEDQESLLQKSVKRFVDCEFVEMILVVTHARYAHFVEKQLAQIDPDRKIRTIVEPYRKNTAPAITLAVRYIEEKLGDKSDTPILVLPSDHLIRPKEVFLSFLEKVKEKRIKDKIIVFGIVPTRPDTGYGYIQAVKKKNALLFEVTKFVEKPELEKAKQYLLDGNTYWNAGIFFFTPQVFWEEMAVHAPQIFEHSRGNYLDLFRKFDQMPDISIDYALMEKTKKILLCPLPVSWSDVGCWDNLYDVLDKDDNRNVKIGNIVDIDTTNSLIIGGKKLISTIGLQDVLIVETPEALFMAKKGESQKVKKLIEELQRRGAKKALGSCEKELLKETLHYQIFTHQLAAFSKISFEEAPKLVRHFIATSGKANVQIGNKKRILKSGGIFSLFAKLSARVENVEDSPFEFLEIHLDCREKQKLLSLQDIGE
jgi:mannose-1-phosphate guanylyltransferase / mannose-6-phosphate isomerase